MPRANRSRKSPGESGTSPEEDPDKDMQSRYVSRHFALLRANYAERPRRPARRARNGPPDDTRRGGDGPADRAQGGDARSERIRRIKQEIQAGTYETEEKLEIAINRLIDDLTGRQKKP